jgi:hypothetical protein
MKKRAFRRRKVRRSKYESVLELAVETKALVGYVQRHRRGPRCDKVYFHKHTMPAVLRTMRMTIEVR